MKDGLNSLLLALLLWFISFTSQAGEVWKITSLDWAPYSSSQMQSQGHSVEKLRNLLKKADIELVVEFHPWIRARQMAKQEEYIGYFPAWPEEVDEGFIATPAIDISWIAVLKREGVELQYDNLEQLFSKYRVGLIGAYDYPEEIAKLANTQDQISFISQDEMTLLKMLNANRFDCAITDPNVMFHLSESYGMERVVIDKIIMEKALVVALKEDQNSRERLELIKKLLETDSLSDDDSGNQSE